MGSLFINDVGPHHSAVLGDISQPTSQDPFRYQHGFGNHHSSEAFAGALPRLGINLPQKHPYGLYAEHLNGTSFISSRESVLNVWMYRVRPSVAHRPVRPCSTTLNLESCFLPLNPNIDFTPLSHTWGPLQQPIRQKQPDEAKPRHANSSRQAVNFFQGLHTICGHGDSTLKEGLAVHMYAFDADMDRQAFVNNDGEFLIVPQRGTLDIQTELGHLRLGPGSIAVIPPGFRFSVTMASLCSSEHGASGYLLEIYGTHFRLPELGPLGANGLAHVRDFQYPVASFDMNLDPDLDPARARAPQSQDKHGDSNVGESPGDWQVITKLGGRLHQYTQSHTPFDVVAWHGRYSPYRYDLAHFTHLTANVDQLDPTAFTVLTAPSRWPGVSLVDVCVFGEKFAVAPHSQRIPYHHRTMATELIGVIRGRYGGSVRRLEAGGLGIEQAYMPHGESYECWRRERDRQLAPEIVGAGGLSFMFHVSAHVGLTKWARDHHPDIRLDDPHFWDNLRAPFASMLCQASMALERARGAKEATVQAELAALSLDFKASRVRVSMGSATRIEEQDVAQTGL